jgi:hypothetical protein
MKTLGIDFAAQDDKTAVVGVEWKGTAARARLVTAGASDDDLLRLIPAADKVGIDVPFGWPDEFVESVTAHHALQPWPGHARRLLRYRATDRVVAAVRKTHKSNPPLSVSSDLIGVAAMRVAGLFHRLGAAEPVQRDGTGRLVEVYPALALDVWGLPSKGYKGAGPLKRAALGALIDAFVSRTRGWLGLEAVLDERCRQKDDVFDALVAALVARAHATDLCMEIPAADRDRARREGWIAVPVEGSLLKLGRPLA